jgi:acetolactate synthase-1/2/3 large subunit
MKNSSELIAEFLKLKKVETVFGIIGSANSYIFDSISNLGYTKIINVHHEQAAVMAAGAYFRTTGKMGVCIVTAGAGASNAITGVLSNWADSIPCLIISGQEPSKYLVDHKDLRMYGTQGFNVVEMTKNITKYGITVSSADDIQNELEKCWDILTTHRFGPVWIDIPIDVQSKPTNRRDWINNISTKKIISDGDLGEVMESIMASSRPVIVGGHGIKLSGAREIFKEFVNRTKIPTLLTWSGIDLLDEDNENFYGRMGLYGNRAPNFIVQNSDLLVVIGSRLAIPQVGYDFSQFARGAKIIVVDIDEGEIKKYEDRYHKYIIGDCFDFLNASIKKITNTPIDTDAHSEWRVHCDKLLVDYPTIIPEHIDNGYINAYKFMDMLWEYTKEDQIITTDMGTALLCGHQAIKLKPNQIMFTSLGLGEMGYGLPGAIGAAVACPNREVLCLNCDGGIMMNLQELHTIIENGLKIKIVIFNNDGYLMIKHTQKMLFKGRYNSVDGKTGIGLPNFSKLFPAFGYKYHRLDNWSDYDITMRGFMDADEASVLEVFMDPEQDFIPKVRGLSKNDGTIVPAPIEDMSPLLPLETMEKEMLVGVSEKSKNIHR